MTREGLVGTARQVLQCWSCAWRLSRATVLLSWRVCWPGRGYCMRCCLWVWPRLFEQLGIQTSRMLLIKTNAGLGSLATCAARHQGGWHSAEDLPSLVLRCHGPSHTAGSVSRPAGAAVGSVPPFWQPVNSAHLAMQAHHHQSPSACLLPQLIR